MGYSSSIAIDGPVASGKSTVGRNLASHLGYSFLDTGFMYRALTLTALLNQIDLRDSAALTHLAHSLDLRFELSGSTGTDVILVSGRDVTNELRGESVEKNVSLVSSYTSVRQVLVHLQQEMARARSIVMVGRDIGTVVLPNADLKVFLIASINERARRRWQEIEYSSSPRPFQDVLDDLCRRDTIDTQRSASPLRPAADAHQIDTEGLNIISVTQTILALLASN